jgi:hypothetical protein
MLGDEVFTYAPWLLFGGSGAGLVLRKSIQPTHEEEHRHHSFGNDRRASTVPLAGQCAGITKRDRTDSVHL